LQVVDVLGVDKKTVLEALSMNAKDFEDAVQIAAAVHNNIKVIVTRNKNDFSDVECKVYTPAEFLSNFSN